MKKFAALLMCFVLGTACFTGCTNNEEAFAPKSYEAEAVTEVCIDVRDRQIEVMPSVDNQIHIDYFENSKEYYDISVSDNHVLTMTAASDKEWTDYIGGKSATGSHKISLQLPDALLTTLNLSTTNEDISLAPLTVVGSVSLSSQGGNIVFDQLNVENSISIDAKNGDVAGSIVGSAEDYTISCNSKKGESNLSPSKGNGTKTLTASNNNGDIDIVFASE